MTSFMERFMGKNKPKPAESAKERLKFVLMTDRTSLSPEELRLMQEEILTVIRKYCRIKEEDVDLKFEQRERENYLVADIPLTGRNDDLDGAVRFEATFISSVADESIDQPAPKTEVYSDESLSDETYPSAAQLENTPSDESEESEESEEKPSNEEENTQRVTPLIDPDSVKNKKDPKP